MEVTFAEVERISGLRVVFREVHTVELHGGTYITSTREKKASSCHALLTQNHAAWAVPKSRCMGCLFMQATVHLEPREATSRLPLL